MEAAGGHLPFSPQPQDLYLVSYCSPDRLQIHFRVQVGLELEEILLPQPPQCWDRMSLIPHPAHVLQRYQSLLGVTCLYPESATPTVFVYKPSHLFGGLDEDVGITFGAGPPAYGQMMQPPSASARGAVAGSPGCSGHGGMTRERAGLCVTVFIPDACCLSTAVAPGLGQGFPQPWGLYFWVFPTSPSGLHSSASWPIG